MHIGFDAKRIYQNATGLGNYSRSVVKNMANHYPSNMYYLFTPNNNTTQVFLTPPNTTCVTHKGRFTSVWRSYGIKKDLLQYDIAIYHGLSNEIPFSLNHTRIKTVVTIHDVIFKKYPKHYPIIDRNIYTIKTAYACNHAHKIIATSEATKKDLMHYYNADEDKISVVYQNCADIFYENISIGRMNSVSERYHLPEQYILYVGSIIERKNLLNICKAYLQIDMDERIPCVVVGKGGKYAENIKQFIAEHNLQAWFIFLANIPDADLPTLYNRAVCLVYPSVYEGFGIPLVEAMASGCPVITSNISSMPEVAGSAARYINPADDIEIAQAIKEIVTNNSLRNDMIAKGKIQVQKFNNTILAEQLYALYASLMQ